MDVDGSGRLSLLAGSNCCDSLGFHLFRRSAGGAFAPREHLKFSNAGKIRLRALFAERIVTAADWDGDGVPDLLTPSDEGIAVALGPFDDRGAIAPAHQIEIDCARKGDAQDFAVADWNRDGKPDLLVLQKHQHRAGGIYWYQNFGGPGMTKLAEGKPLVLIPSGVHVDGFCVGDWNGDGWPDLIATREESMGKRPDGSHVGWRSSTWLYLRE